MTRMPPPSQIFPVIVGVLMLFGGLHSLATGSAQQRQYAAGALGATKDVRAVEPVLAVD